MRQQSGFFPPLAVLRLPVESLADLLANTRRLLLHLRLLLSVDLHLRGLSHLELRVAVEPVIY